MACIKENRKGEQVTSYRFSVYLGRTPEGKLIKKTMTWKPPETLTPAKARKAAECKARQWEREVKTESQEKEGPTAPPPPDPEPKADDFVSFIDSVWFPLEIEGSDRKPRTVAFYRALLKTLKPYFQGMVLQEITSIDIQKYLRYLRKEYQGKHGIGLTPKTVHHHYNILLLKTVECDDMFCFRLRVYSWERKEGDTIGRQRDHRPVPFALRTGN